VIDVLITKIAKRSKPGMDSYQMGYAAAASAIISGLDPSNVAQ
jgi:hypothetical protein